MIGIRSLVTTIRRKPSFFDGLGRLFKIVFGALGLLIFAVVSGAGVLYHRFSRDLPKMVDISSYKPPIVSEVFADDGTKIGEFWQECRFLVPFDEIPSKLVDAFIASEDERFWDHKGVDFQSILRAFVQNLKAGHVVQGGSTITQQVTRSLLLSRVKSFDRKIREAILATQIERTLTKKDILFLYLNQIYLGNRSYGVAAAARNYFHKDLKDLNLAEISLIAGLPSAPNSYSPINSPELAKSRQMRVLQRMVANDYISHKEAQAALDTTLKVYRAGIDKDFNNRFAPFFVEHVRRTIEQKYGQDALYYGGLKIHTTASVLANRAAEKAVKRGLLEVERRKGFHGPIAKIAKENVTSYREALHREIVELDEPFEIPPPAQKNPSSTPLEDSQIYKGIIMDIGSGGMVTVAVGYASGLISPQDYAWTGRMPKVGEVYWVKKKGHEVFAIEQEPRLESALFSFNPLSGKVVAMVGGFSFKRSEFDRTSQALRQPGSAFKPVIYSAALDKGYTPKTMITDASVMYQVGRNDFWSPKNYGDKFNGPMSLRSALTHSVNIVAVKIFHDIGIPYVVAYARKLGLVSPIHKYLSSSLGASDMTLQELTRAYGTFPAGGVRHDLTFILKITDRDGKVLEENDPSPIDPDQAFESKSKDNANDGINTDLRVEGEKVIKEEKIKLTPDEIKILYGSAIPPGHVITPQTAFLMVHLMKDVIQQGTGFKARELKRPAAGKTGTTNDESDAWFIGTVPNLIAGVWLGYDDHKPIGKKMTGGVVAAPIWLYYMQEVLKEEPVREFHPPSSLAIAGIDSMTGGSAVNALFKSEEEPPEEESPASRGVDFLFKDPDAE